MLATLRNRLSRQLSHPSGRGGKLIAAAMNRGNRKMNERAIELLGVSGDQRVLDIGFGGGRAVELMLERGLNVTGVDPASDMVAALNERRADEVRAGRLEALEGGVEALPLADDSVDAVLTVNTVYFWSGLPGPLAEIGRVLRPGGTVVIAIRDGAVMTNVDLAIFTIRTPEEIRAALEAAGFEARVESPSDQQVHFVVGVKSD